MKRSLKRLLLPLLAAALFAAGAWGQYALSKRRIEGSPALGESIIATLGGLRSLAAEVVWFRAERLQDEGRYGELVQLATILTWLQPHDSEVWTFSSWNLAYNISVRMPTLEDRWRWVHSAIKLLRDEGLKWNPGDPEICKELAFMYETKIGIDGNDAAARLYRAEWRKITEDLIARDAWEEIGMDKRLMTEVSRKFGVTDWTNAQASALYWAYLGLGKADAKQRPYLNEVFRQAKTLYDRDMKGES